MDFNKPMDSFYIESSTKRWLKTPLHESKIDIKANATKWRAASPKSCQTNQTERGNFIY